MQKVKSVKHLKTLLNRKHKAFFIALNYGVISRKEMKLLKNGKFLVYNYIDNTTQRPFALPNTGV